jgi:hypothetical protein
MVMVPFLEQVLEAQRLLMQQERVLPVLALLAAWEAPHLTCALLEVAKMPEESSQEL